MSPDFLVLFLLLQIIAAEVVRGQIQPRRKFRKATLCNGTDICAVDLPSAVLTFLPDQPVVDRVCVSPNVLCAWRCSKDKQCVGYNYKTFSRQCEMYHDTPNNFHSQNGCSYFQVFFDGIIWPSITSNL